jgi:hypothetical protein
VKADIPGNDRPVCITMLACPLVRNSFGCIIRLKAVHGGFWCRRMFWHRRNGHLSSLAWLFTAKYFGVISNRIGACLRPGVSEDLPALKGRSSMDYRLASFKSRVLLPALKEYFISYDSKEVARCLQEFNQAGFHSLIVNQVDQLLPPLTASDRFRPFVRRCLQICCCTGVAERYRKAIGHCFQLWAEKTLWWCPVFLTQNYLTSPTTLLSREIMTAWCFASSGAPPPPLAPPITGVLLSLVLAV